MDLPNATAGDSITAALWNTLVAAINGKLDKPQFDSVLKVFLINGG